MSISIETTVQVSATLTVSEGQLRALDALIRRDVPVALHGIDESRKHLGIPKSSGKWIKREGSAT